MVQITLQLYTSCFPLPLCLELTPQQALPQDVPETLLQQRLGHPLANQSTRCTAGPAAQVVKVEVGTERPWPDPLLRFRRHNTFISCRYTDNCPFVLSP